MERFIIDETSNTLTKCSHHMPPERLDYLVIPHQYNAMQIDRIGPHCFDGLVIPLPSIKDRVKYLEASTCENTYILNVTLSKGLKIDEKCFTSSERERLARLYKRMQDP